jgi:predicted NACHT family NTPase
MSVQDDLSAIFDRIANGKETDGYLQALRELFRKYNCLDAVQLGKYNVNIGQGQDIHIGDRTYVTWNDEAIQALIEVVQKLQSTTQTPTPQLASVDDLVQQVRSRLHDDIQCLHGTMPLWGVDRWVQLGDLFVDVNILEEMSSSRRSELDDLWQDFSKNPNYRSLDRIGLGKERQRMSGLKVLAKNTNLIVVGKPGSGKTTYVQRVVTECNGGNLQAHRIPALIKLREFVEDGRDVAYSVERYLERCWRLSDAEIQLILDRGRALVLLDGLDEVTGEDGKNIAYEIKRFVRAYPQVQVIVTCRTQSQESQFERFDYVEVADFNEPQLRAFGEHWFKTVMGDELAGLVRAQEFLGLLFLEENKPIRELAITPILLSLSCAVFHQTGKFYSKRSKLYEEGLELLLEQWDKSREIERDEIYRDLSVERKLELLSYLAVKKFEQPQYVLFEQAEIEGYIAEFLEIGQRDSRAVLKALESQHGLLIERSQKVWSFSHLTFQEYLVAQYFLTSCCVTNLVNYTFNEHWREVFLLFFEKTQIVDRLLIDIKLKIDNFLQVENKYQKMLAYINAKVFTVQSEYNSAALRAFYFAIVRSLNHRLSLDLSHVESLSSFFDDSLAQALDNKLNIPCKLDDNYSFCDDLLIDYKFAHGYYPAPYSLPELDSELEKLLQKFEPKLPYHIEDEYLFKEWWKYHGKSWVKKIRSIMLEFRNLGQDWELSDSQEKILKQYYNANKLLIDCLNSGCVVSDEVREEIEDTLLLPIAEIEKRKRENAE